MNEAERKATLAHLLEFEDSLKLARHLAYTHALELPFDSDLRDLDELHVAEHRRVPVRPWSERMRGK